jgi:hypothetical protein
MCKEMIFSIYKINPTHEYIEWVFFSFVLKMFLKTFKFFI